jgi:hypothetical protein
VRDQGAVAGEDDGEGESRAEQKRGGRRRAGESGREEEGRAEERREATD